MGINKLPEAGHTQFLRHPQEKKAKAAPDVNQSLAEKISVRKTALKDSSGNKVQRLKANHTNEYELNVTSSGASVSGRSSVYPGIHWEAKDILTGEIFSGLAGKSFEKKRPYCFAVAIATNEKISEKKKIFMDGSKFLRIANTKDLEIPGSVALGVKGGAEFLHEVQFFAAREKNRIESIGSFREATHGPDCVILSCLILQEDNETYESVGDATNVIIASAYSLGVGVEKDEEYANRVMSEIDKKHRAHLSPELFSFALANGEDTRMTEFLLDNGFDPSVRDPYEGATSVQMADHYEKKEMLRVFERYGYGVEQ